MKEQVSVEHKNCSCPNCVPVKIRQLKCMDGQTITIQSDSPVVLNLPGHTQIETAEYERLKRLDENVQLKIKRLEKQLMLYKLDKNNHADDIVVTALRISNLQGLYNEKP